MYKVQFGPTGPNYQLYMWWRDGWRCSLQGIVWAGRPKLLAVQPIMHWVQKQCTRYSLGRPAQTISCTCDGVMCGGAVYRVQFGPGGPNYQLCSLLCTGCKSSVQGIVWADRPKLLVVQVMAGWVGCSLQGIVWAGRPKLLAVYELMHWMQVQCTRYSLGRAAQTISCVSHDALGFSALYRVQFGPVGPNYYMSILILFYDYNILNIIMLPVFSVLVLCRINLSKVRDCVQSKKLPSKADIGISLEYHKNVYLTPSEFTDNY